MLTPELQAAVERANNPKRSVIKNWHEEWVVVQYIEPETAKLLADALVSADKENERLRNDPTKKLGQFVIDIINDLSDAELRFYEDNSKMADAFICAWQKQKQEIERLRKELARIASYQCTTEYYKGLFECVKIARYALETPIPILRGELPEVKE